MNLLILSIGSNPMPNFIVADYLLSCARDKSETDLLPIPDKILFVYSSKTEHFKKTILDKINFHEENCYQVSIGEDQRKYDRIKERVSKELKKIQEKEKENISTIHLNYTGGTKPMAVGISSAVESFQGCYECKKIFSDLSPSKMKLTLRNGDEYPTNGKMSDQVKITVEELYALHDLKEPNCKKLKRENSDLYSDKFAKYLFDKNNDYKNGDREFLKQWCFLNLSSKQRKIRKELKNKSEKYEKMTSGVLNNKIEEWKKELKKSISDFWPTNHSKVLDRTLGEFIRGIWLEEYLFATLLDLKKECKLTDMAWDIETEIHRRKFQLDVIAIKGCRTFVFTCTTDYSSDLCKGKAFEGFYRSNQIGGEASKTILVCMADNYDENRNIGNPDYETVKNIENDMSQFDAAKNFRILGSEDIRHRENFKEILIDLIEGD